MGKHDLKKLEEQGSLCTQPKQRSNGHCGLGLNLRTRHCYGLGGLAQKSKEGVLGSTSREICSAFWELVGGWGVGVTVEGTL